MSKLLKFSKIPVSEGSFFLISFCELLKFPEIPITRAPVLTILQPMCPSYPDSPKYQLPGVLFNFFFVNYSNSLKYQLPGPLFWLSSNQRVQVTQIP